MADLKLATFIRSVSVHLHSKIHKLLCLFIREKVLVQYEIIILVSKSHVYF